jgi:RHH-type proline utilization regulon transcriptional repressor/proline dehydrogenase/delta 1-pyrroline-5-carboxylate dehydrogenase
MSREIFGPVLHIATFRASEIDAVIDEVNATGYGLTFGLHSRIDDRVQRIVDRLHVGNIYVNRNQIGAVVGSQPFGGEGLSGTGPKAGGPQYLPRFTAHPAPQGQADQSQTTADEAQAALLSMVLPDDREQALILPGPTGESNRLVLVARSPLLCLGPGAATALAQAESVRSLGGKAVEAPGLPAEALGRMTGFSGALYWGPSDLARPFAQALALRQGPILPLITGQPDPAHARLERHICIDTTASGGNAQLLALAAQAGRRHADRKPCAHVSDPRPQPFGAHALCDLRADRSECRGLSGLLVWPALGPRH